MFSKSDSAGEAGYGPVPIDSDGFQFSAVFDCSYCLQRTRNRYGRLQYTLLEKRP